MKCNKCHSGKEYKKCSWNNCKSKPEFCRFEQYEFYHECFKHAMIMKLGLYPMKEVKS